MEPLVSVIIPMYNREKTICRAIDSVLNQSYKNMEIIIVDDGSNDASVEKVQPYVNANRNIRLVKMPHNSGPSAARNMGIKEAEGDYIAFQDSDDEWLPNKLKIQMDHMLEKGYQVMFCPYILMLEEDFTQEVPSIHKMEKIATESVVNVLRKESIIGTPTLIINKEVVEQIGYFDETMPSIEDYEYVIRIAKQYDIGYVDQRLVKAYRLDKSITTNRKANYIAVEMLLDKHGDFLDLESMLRASLLFHTLDYDDEFGKVVERMRQSYVEGENARAVYFNNALIKVLSQKYIQKRIIEKSYLESKISQLRDKEFAIYGAGYFGRKIYYELKHHDICAKYFIVSQNHGNTNKHIDNVPIKEICDVEDKNIEIIVAVSMELQREILENLCRYQFNNYFILEDVEDLDWERILNL